MLNKKENETRIKNHQQDTFTTKKTVHDVMCELNVLFLTSYQ